MVSLASSPFSQFPLGCCTPKCLAVLTGHWGQQGSVAVGVSLVRSVAGTPQSLPPAYLVLIHQLGSGSPNQPLL